FLEKHGIEAVETDLGEFIVQIDGDHPSHIVTPIVHKNRRQVAESFERHGLGAYNDDPTTITRRARNFLRGKYLEADVGLTGANFVSAESGRIVLVTNEGNARFSMAAPKVHIVLVGIEKLVPYDKDLGLFLALLGRSATGQHLTVYTQFIGGPHAEQQPDGPEHMHVVFLDNRRTEVLASECKEILRCIRCGACLNVCPIYRQASGHAYRSVYPGPVGAVLSPLLQGPKFSELADLPKASSLCGACNEVCPVDIPIPDLLLRLRNKGKTEKAPKASIGTPGFGMWSILATQPAAWKTALRMGHVMNLTPHRLLNIHPSAKAWQSARDLPEFRGGAFRDWFKNRNKRK
ncbi:MAG: lactate utilization protein, partial [Verrucomicrobia bacterium]|nr:lactate utilization protein [Verrucomicrobiota bacterium]